MSQKKREVRVKEFERASCFMEMTEVTEAQSREPDGE